MGVFISREYGTKYGIFCGEKVRRKWNQSKYEIINRMPFESSFDSSDNRLGKCEVCDFNQAKYTCPKCEVKTCSVDCLKIHKKELNCDGVRDRTKYIPMKNISESDLMHDYVFLENCTNYTMARKRDKIKRITAYHRTLPAQLNKLKVAAQERSITLQFLLQNFEKHKSNSTFYDWQTKIIHWRVEWRFLNANNRKCVDARCSEHETIVNLASKYFHPNDEYTDLEYYRSKGLTNVRFLLKAEGVRCSRNRYYALDRDNTLAENLRRRTVVEFPVITVVYDTDCNGFDIIDSGESSFGSSLWSNCSFQYWI